ncbi:hypothetical protein NQ314_006309 [Rhamnusium bicolor]|nr:hypothetical protein NQ314_006309 [Rhamnusium bicolor]
MSVPSVPIPNRSWASLFKSNSDAPRNSVIVEDKRAADEEVEVCPSVKHPGDSESCVDTDRHRRMGKYINGHCVDGRAANLRPRGLINPGNFCFMNAVLQALVACSPLFNLLSGLSQVNASNGKRTSTPVIDGMCHFAMEFDRLPMNATKVKNTRRRRSEGGNRTIITDVSLMPSRMHQMLGDIRSDMVTGRQQDAEEYLGCILNGLHEEMLGLTKATGNGADAEAAEVGSVSGGFGRTPIADIFGGLLRSRIHRDGDRATDNFEPFFTLQLDIRRARTVREALETLVAKQSLEGLVSSRTNRVVEAWQQVTLDELPVILVLHLKCFDFGYGGCRKITRALEYPLELSIDGNLLSTNACLTTQKKGRRYKLFAVVYHDGREAGRGHYLTDAFHSTYGSWIRYDDASVRPVQQDDALKPQGDRVPYLLFYRHSDTVKRK